jgi:hypothetical protein
MTVVEWLRLRSGALTGDEGTRIRGPSSAGCNGDRVWCLGSPQRLREHQQNATRPTHVCELVDVFVGSDPAERIEAMTCGYRESVVDVVNLEGDTMHADVVRASAGTGTRTGLGGGDPNRHTTRQFSC